MYRLAGFYNPRQAQAFIDYMAYRGIEISMAPEPEGKFALWLADEQYLVEAEAELNAFLLDPNNKKYQAASWQVAESRTAKFNYSNPSLINMVKAQAGPFTLLVMVASLVIYGLWLLGFEQVLFEWLHFPFMNGDQWELWRYFSHALLHFSPIHVIFNCLWWWLLGGQIERHSGSAKLVQIFLLSSLVSGFGQFWLDGPNFGGLSGVVYALLGYIWWMGWLAPQRGLVIARSYVVFMLVWLVIGFAEPMGMSIANMAHLFGLISGCVIALFDAKVNPLKQAK
ncbi:intramembrane serine protease GlpG [Photobacterium angustum]|uniref:Rhomboid family intramembrane serine protease GlpG n=1 Tax=Photobacterium angustum TaxID=661 RepID=A0ABX5H332_PHOAN|nr:rhomboid family intramembrane serine protease GlpG [Photobacterium angustum]KJG05156.1 intramembrane serine protease GlpG [Photobacterium angustum]KJG36693.1 intramembrane serine protease GlpG [Photobacterium angustum]PSV92970.1 rhomboid family intramembrane serine protease GlpG [Photobacterium angustum]PSW79438.1 rhomboid family intramembrane serine protease GlpG [Photobacterium angustum]PSX08939.1 rhomboid family intramembrane serine protease GlpG [Photobacterium angustum]